MTVLSTVRFKLTPARKSSSVELHTLWTSQGVRRFLFDDEVLHYEKTVELLAESERLNRTEGTGLWLITTQEAEDLHGFVGFWYGNHRSWNCFTESTKDTGDAELRLRLRALCPSTDSDLFK